MGRSRGWTSGQAERRSHRHLRPSHAVFPDETGSRVPCVDAAGFLTVPSLGRTPLHGGWWGSWASAGED